MENTLRQADGSQFSACKMEREPDGTLLFRFAQTPGYFMRLLSVLVGVPSAIAAFFLLIIGAVATFAAGEMVGILMIGGAVFLYWFSVKWLPTKLLASGELRIVPDVGFKLSNGDLPFKDVLKYIEPGSLGDSYDIRVVTASGSHVIARCATSDARTALISSLQREGVMSSRTG